MRAIDRRYLLQRLCGAAVIAGVVFLGYSPAIRGDYVLDDRQLMSSELITSPDGLYRLWFTTQGDDYWPATSTTFWIEWRLWRLDPTGYHVTNLVLHIGSCLLIWRILNVLEIPGGFLAALLFAVHPVNVESVAWIAQRKNVLAMVFFLLAILWYLRADGAAAETGESETNRIKWVWYGLSFAAGVLGMLSKGSVIILPAILLLVIWWRRRMQWIDALRLAPFCLAAIVFTFVNMWFQTHGREIVLRDVTFTQRLAGAGAVVWFYLAKAVLPVHLSFLYPQWQIDASKVLWWLSLCLAAAVTALLILKRDEFWARSVMLARFVVCIALVPVIGFVDVGYMRHSLVADHYEHVALVAVVALTAALVPFQRAEVETVSRAILFGGMALIVGSLAFLAYRLAGLYAGPMQLYPAALADNPASWLAHNNLGLALTDAGQVDRAVAQFELALVSRPDYADAENNLGAALASGGRYNEAFEHYEKALKLDSKFAEAYANYGNAMARAGDVQRAILNPELALAHKNLADLLTKLGRHAEANDHYKEAVRLKSSITNRPSR